MNAHSGIRTHDLLALAAENILYLRPRSHCYGRLRLLSLMHYSKTTRKNSPLNDQKATLEVHTDNRHVILVYDSTSL
jgi:hypothetical protein